MKAELQCPSRGELTAYLSGEVFESRQQEISDHLSHCAVCLDTLDRCVAEDTTKNTETVLSIGPADADDELVLSEPECKQMIAAAQEIRLEQELNPDGHAAARATDRRRRALPAALGPYELLERIGEGGMGAVYKARHKRLERIVSLKIIAEHRVADPQSLDRFCREWIALAKLQNSHVVQAFDAGDDAGFHYLVMEYVEGVDLARLVRRGGRLKIADACEIIRQAALGLEFFHQSRLVHRDIKPSNLMIDVAGTVKILDLGLAAWQNDDSGRSGLTVEQQILGTVDYMAPEQAFDSHVAEIRADIYSLGCTLYFLLSGHAPFGGGEYSGTLKKLLAHSQAPRPSIAAERSDVPTKLDALVRRMIARSPADRPASPSRVLSELAAFVAGNNLERLARDETPSNLDGCSAAAAAGRFGNFRRRCIAVPAAVVDRVRRSTRRTKVALTVAALAAAATILFLILKPVPVLTLDTSKPAALGSLSPRSEQQDEGKWHNLLSEKPAELLLEVSYGAGWWNYDVATGQIHFSSPGRMLLQLGLTDEPNYEFLATFNETPWNGNVGIYFGCHATKINELRYQNVELLYRQPTKEHVHGSFVMERNVQTIVNHEKHFMGTLDTVGLKAVPTTSRNHMFRIVVRNRKIEEVWLDKEALADVAAELEIPPGARKYLSIGPEDSVGGFGIYADSGSATVLDARYRILKGEAVHGR